MVCHRAAALQFMQVPPVIRTTPEQELIFGIGNWTHHMWQAYFKDMERVLGSDVVRFLGHELWCSVPKLYMAGNLDVHLELKGQPAIIDIKTINDAGFTSLTFSNRPNPDHVAQLTRYMRAVKVKMGLLLYCNKNDQRFRVFVVPYSKAEWYRSVEWLKKGIGYLRDRKVPPMHENCTADSSMRRYCKWAYCCWGSDTPDLEQLLYADKPAFDDLWEETCRAST